MVEALVSGDWQHADIVSFWMFDSDHWCECDQCKAQGSITDRFLRLVDVVFDEIKIAQEEGRLQRRIYLSPLAYMKTVFPPTRPLPEGFNYDDCLLTFFPIGRCYNHTFSDSSCTEVNKWLCESFYKWAKDSDRYYEGDVFIGEYFNVSSIMSLPVVYTKIMSADIPFYRRNGAKHLNYMHTPIENWGTWTLNQYLLGRLLWDIDVDAEKLIDDYYARYYPTTTETTSKFYQHLETALANIKAFKHFVRLEDYSVFQVFVRWSERLTKKGKKIFWIDHLKYRECHPPKNDGIDVVETMEELKEARKWLNKSMIKCENKVEAARLKEDDRRFVYCEKTFGFLHHLLRTGMFYHADKDEFARAEFAKAEKYVPELKKIDDLMNRRESDDLDGFKATQALKVYEFFKEKYGD